MTAPESTPPRPPLRALSGASLGLVGDAPGGYGSFEVRAEDRYVDGGVLGRGGMGEIRVVFDARLDRHVAIKTPVLAHPAMWQQFIEEARLTAGLGHPGIVTVLDAGILPDGRPYYTMPIIEGHSLAQAIEGASVAARLRLIKHFLDACNAVAFAHAEGLVHRDLKPANILVGRFGETLVVDWGLAGPSGQRPAGVVGTPSYMAPEQVCGDPLDARTDVWALGVSLRELVTGSARGKPDRDSSPELMAIVARACAPEPADRYPDAHALAEDVAAWFEGRRVAAHRYGLRELVARAWATHRVALLASLAGVVGVATATSVGYLRTAAERAHAIESERRAVAARGRAEDALAQAEIAQAVTAMTQSAWPEAELFAAGALTHAASARARGVLTRFDAASRPRLVERTALPPCRRIATSRDGGTIACDGGGRITVGMLDRGWREAWSVSITGEPVAVIAQGPRVAVRESDGRLSVVGPNPQDEPAILLGPGSAPQRFHVRDRWLSWVSGSGELWAELDTGQVARTQICAGEGRSTPGAVGRRADGSLVVSCQDGGVFVARSPEAHARELLRLPSSLGGPVLIDFAPDRDGLVALAMAKGGAVVIDLDAPRLLRTIEGELGSPASIALSQQRLALADDAGRVDVWELATGALAVRMSALVSQLRWQGDDVHLRLVGDEVQDFALPRARARTHVQHDGSGVAAIALSSDGRHVASVHGDGHLRVAMVDALDPLATIPLHWSVAKDVEFSPDGSRLATITAQDDSIRIYALAAMPTPTILPASAGARLAWLADDVLVLAPYGNGLALWRDGVLVPERFEALGRIADMETDADRRTLTMVSDGGDISRLGADLVVEPVAWRPDVIAVVGHGDRVAVLRDHVVELLERGEPLREAALDGIGGDIALSPDGRLVAVAFASGEIEVRAASTLEPLAVLQGHRGRVASLAFDHAGTWLASGSWDGELRQWSLATLERPAAGLLSDIERDWGRSLQQLLAASSGSARDPSGW
ncbi:MAG: WD40 repeat domain-containing serine/threonine protein kinase [Nannocystaceae bacterium]